MIKLTKLPTSIELMRSICCGEKCLNPIECLMRYGHAEAKRVGKLLKNKVVK